MTSTIVKVIWVDFGSISTRLTRNLLIFNPCALVLQIIELLLIVWRTLPYLLSGTSCTIDSLVQYPDLYYIGINITFSGNEYFYKQERETVKAIAMERQEH